MPIKVDELTVYDIKGKARGGGYCLVLRPLGIVGGKDAIGPFASREAALAYHDKYLTMPYNDEVEVEVNGMPATKIVRRYFERDSELRDMSPLRPEDLDPEKPNEEGYGIWEIAIQVFEWQVVT